MDVQFTLCMLCTSSELEVVLDFVVSSVNVQVRCQQQQTKQIEFIFPAKLCFAFSRAGLCFSNMFVDKLNVCEFEKKLREFLM